VKKLIKLGILKILILARITTLDSSPALAYSSGNTTIINTEAPRYSLMDRKFIFDYSNSKNEKMEVKNLNLLTPSIKPLTFSKECTQVDNKKNTNLPANLVKNTNTQGTLKNNWSKFKKSSSHERLDETNLEVKAKLLR
jgi:hypothetical protein